MEDYISKLVSFRRRNDIAENIRYFASNITEWQSFNFKQGDIFLVTYPKCGTNWMKYIIWGILNKGETPPDFNQMMYGKFFTPLEFIGTKDADNIESPRLFQSHLPPEVVPFSAQAKYIHVTRNPLDCCLSYYNHTMKVRPESYEGDSWNQFFDDFLEGNVNFGDYFPHALGWYKHKDEDNYLHITYEEMSNDHRGSILKVAKFLGEDYYREIVNDEEVLKKIEYHSSFSFMTSLPKLRTPIKRNFFFGNVKWGKYDALADDEKFKTIEFFGKGQVGLFKTALSEEQKQKLRKKMEEKLRNTDLLHHWDEYLRG